MDDMTRLKEEIINYFYREYEYDYTVEEFERYNPNLEEVGIAYSTTENELNEIQVNLNIKTLELSTYIDENLYEKIKYDSIDDLIEDIKWWDFETLVSIDFEEYEKKEKVEEKWYKKNEENELER